MRNAILYIFSLIVSFAVGIAAYGSYLSHDYSMSTKPEPTTQYVYIEREPEVITETVYIEVEPTFYRSLTEDEQLQHAADFAAKKIRARNPCDDPQKLKQRVTAAIVRRGYSWSIALKAYHCALLQEETNAD